MEPRWPARNPKSSVETSNKGFGIGGTITLEVHLEQGAISAQTIIVRRAQTTFAMLLANTLRSLGPHDLQLNVTCRKSRNGLCWRGPSITDCHLHNLARLLDCDVTLLAAFRLPSPTPVSFLPAAPRGISLGPKAPLPLHYYSTRRAALLLCQR